MGILALDPSILHLGWAALYLDNHEIKLHSFGTIMSPEDIKRAPTEERMGYMLDHLNTQLINLNYENDFPMGVGHIVMERAEPWGSYKSLASSRSGSLELLTLFTGALAGWALTHLTSERVHLVKVSKWKGQVPKHVTKKRMERKYPVTFKTTDEADAAGLGHWFLTEEEKK